MSSVTPPLGNRIASFTDHPTSIDGLEPRISEAHLRVDADAKSLSFPATRYFKRQYLRAVRVDEQKQAAAVVQLVRPGTRLRRRILVSVRWSRAIDRRSPAAGRNVPLCFSLYPETIPPPAPDSNTRSRISWTKICC